MTLKFTRTLMTLLLSVVITIINAQVTSTFDSSDEDWLVAGDAKSAIPGYNQTGGNPDGYISSTDATTGGVWYWSAPPKFLGNQGSAFGKTFQFDLKQSGLNNQFYSNDVIITGGGITIACDLTPNPDIMWTHYDVPLDTTLAWKINDINGTLATSSDIESVLSDITNLRIRGEFITGPDVGGLDNVILPSSVLPIYLLKFSGLLQKNNILLQWSTSSEINSSYFNIERSGNGSHFESISKINASGNSTNINAYTFTDNSSIQGKNFYRLKMVDKDGKYNYSSTILIINSSLPTVKVFPNPVIDKITIDNLPEGYVTKVNLLNIKGQVIKEQISTSKTFAINLNNYPSGIYFVNIYFNNQTHQFKIYKK